MCHPILFNLISLVEKGVNLKEWIGSLTTKEVTLNDGGKYPLNEIRYYYQKYILLSKNNYFETVDTGKKIAGKLDTELLESILANSEQLVFEVTDSCNLECTYCCCRDFYENYDKREAKCLSLEKAKNLLNYLYHYWQSPLNRSPIRVINIGFYGGEPLLNFNLIKQIVAYVEDLQNKTNLFSFSFGMTTNGLLLGKYMDYLVKKKFELLVSLDGNKSNNAHRLLKNGESSFDLVMENLSSLRARYPGYFEKKVEFNTVIHDKNSVPEVHSFFKKSFDKVPRISEVNTVGVKESKKEEFMTIYKDIRDSLENCSNMTFLEDELFTFLPGPRDLTFLLFGYCNYIFQDYNELIFPKRESVKIPSGTCRPFSRKIYITVNGKILPCERIGCRYYLGTVDDKKVSLSLEDVAKRYNDFFDKMLPKCKTCAFSSNCSECIFTLGSFGVKGGTFKCRSFKTSDKLAKYLSKNLSYLEENPGFYSIVFKEAVIT